MDDRTQRLGQHTAQTVPSWAVAALGPVPADPAGRHQWEHKASAIAAYREMYGYNHPGDPIGPEPSHQTPDQRAAWHEALTTLKPADGPDVRAIPDGWLWLIRDTYAAETAWAPRYVGKELRLSRLGAFDAGLGAIRADAGIGVSELRASVYIPHYPQALWPDDAVEPSKRVLVGSLFGYIFARVGEPQRGEFSIGTFPIAISYYLACPQPAR
jgi:hypothetical protein